MCSNYNVVWCGVVWCGVVWGDLLIVSGTDALEGTWKEAFVAQFKAKMHNWISNTEKTTETSFILVRLWKKKSILMLT